MATLTLENVTKKFGRQVVAVKDFSLEVEDGEFLVLLGPSGCGKTTTMRMVAGLEDVTRGRIYIGDREITELPPRRRNVSMIFQNYAIWPHMSVYENIAYALRLKKMQSEEIDEVVREVAGLVKIGELLKRYPGQLSGGQQQRVAVARAIAVRPSVFLMDEPLSNLDAKLRGSMRTELKAIHVQTGATSVFVTHDQSEAMSMADRIVVMKDGEIMQIGSPQDVYDKSVNMFVADFIGTPPTNFLAATMQRENGQYVLKSPYFTYQPEPDESAALEKTGLEEVVLGVRPENILLTGTGEALFSTETLVVEPQGSHQIVAIKLDDQIVKIVAPSRPRINAGERIHVAFKTGAVHFFDPESGNRIRIGD